MKLKTRLGSKTAVTANLEEAKQILGELGYLGYKPAEAYRVKNGFVAINNKAGLHPLLLILSSRGSFLEVRTSEFFAVTVIKKLRRNLSVPIYIGAVVLVGHDDDLSVHVAIEEKEALSLLYV